MSKQSSADVPVVNIANALTVVRLILVPVFIVMVLHGNDMGMLLATLVFTVAALTDKLDGYLARRLNLITNFGKLADPIVGDHCDYCARTRDHLHAHGDGA